MKNLTDEQVQGIGATLYQILGQFVVPTAALDLALALANDEPIHQDPLDLLPFHVPIEDRLASLIEDAEGFGKVVTIHLEPQPKLAMGNYKMVGEIRDARKGDE